MRRYLAAFAALSLFALQGQSLGFHVHAVAGAHQDDDHRHGPAIHPHNDFDSALHVDERDVSAGGSVITMAVPAATVSPAVVVYAELTKTRQGQDLQLIGDAGTIDVRSHGPPQSRIASPRGPPTSIQS